MACSACTCPALARSSLSYAANSSNPRHENRAVQVSCSVAPHACAARVVDSLKCNTHQDRSRATSSDGIPIQLQGPVAPTVYGELHAPSASAAPTPSAAAIRLQWQTALLSPPLALQIQDSSLLNPPSSLNWSAGTHSISPSSHTLHRNPTPSASHSPHHPITSIDRFFHTFSPIRLHAPHYHHPHSSVRATISTPPINLLAHRSSGSYFATQAGTVSHSTGSDSGLQNSEPQHSATESRPQSFQAQNEDLIGLQSAEDLVHAESTADYESPAHAAAYLPAKQATGRDDGKEALSQKERYVDKVGRLFSVG